jgi:hypothetical protein
MSAIVWNITLKLTVNCDQWAKNLYDLACNFVNVFSVIMEDAVFPTI